VYDVTFHDGLVYAASYSGGDITCYDPGKPWDQWNHKNPRPAARAFFTRSYRHNRSV
jgi:hypothetical protein